MKKSMLLMTAVTLVCTACAPASETIKIGFIAGLTGDFTAIGSDELAGVTMAVDAINAMGGIDGRLVQLVAEDGKCSGADGATAAQKLVGLDGVTAIIGGGCSGETLAAAPIVEAAKTVLMSPSASSPDITTAGAYIYRVYPSDALKTKSMAAYAAAEGFTRVAVISENTDYCQALKTSLIADLPAGAVVFDESVDPGTKDYRSILTRLKDVDFDVLVVNSNFDSVSALIVQQFREQNFTQPILGADTMDSAQIAAIAGAAAEGVKIVNVPTAGEGTSFETDFQAKNGPAKASISWAAFSYDAANVLFQAIQAVGTDGAAIKEYLDTMPPYTGVVGTFSFDENGDPVGISYVLKEIQDGKIVTVKPL